jgi:RimJ/RimL family protein N-acetyltransferase
MNLSVREMKRGDIDLIVDYFINADSEFLKGMGADKNKLPNKKEWINKLNQEIEKPIKNKEFHYIIWLLEDQPVGHSNINKINFGQTASMHLHLWSVHERQKGLGIKFLKKTIPIYFNNFKLEKLICEPYSKNIAPNKILIKTGFKFIKTYQTVPGLINFYQSVNSYEMTKGQLKK